MQSRPGGQGAVLTQDGHIVAFAGMHLKAAEQNYIMQDMELLAVMLAVMQWRRGASCRWQCMLACLSLAINHIYGFRLSYIDIAECLAGPLV